MLRPHIVLPGPPPWLRKALACVDAPARQQTTATTPLHMLRAHGRATPAAAAAWPAQRRWHPRATPTAARPTSRRLVATTTSRRGADDLPDLDKVAALVTGARDRLLGHAGIPTEGETATALRVCSEAADLLLDAAVQPQLSSIDQQADTTASTLLSLDGSSSRSTRVGSGNSTGSISEDQPSKPAVPARLRTVVQQISDAAFAVVDEPRVHMTPALLAQYVHIQARLGHPESLPRVLDRYAAQPVVAAGVSPAAATAAASPASVPSSSSSSSSRSPSLMQRVLRPAKAVDANVAEAALDAAIASKSLDAAVGVVEYTFAAPAFVRAKVLRRGCVPAFVMLGVPAATYLLAERLAAFQTVMETRTATTVAFAAIFAYIGFTGTIGVIATSTANDHMRRVSWAPGTPLHERWLREEERAALDKVACAFGFSEADRYGEEEGAEFQALREYIMRKGMLLDPVELMEGMSS